jgi:23S rRNA pseudouridine1911/1915/1917 synthase
MRQRRLRSGDSGDDSCGLGLKRSTPRRLRLVVSRSEGGWSLEQLLTERGALPGAVFREVLERGGIRLNGRRATTSDRVSPGDQVVAHVLSRASREAEGQLDASRILHLDGEIVAVDKPAGIPAQGVPSDPEAGLDHAVIAFLAARGEKDVRVGVVHRLDAETSGVTVFGRTPRTIASLSEQFRGRSVEKHYSALVSGRPNWETRVVDEPIGSDPGRPGSFVVSPQGRPALTTFQVEARFGLAAQVEARPETGRTHQIRVHLAHAGHPILGDARYAGPVALTSPTGERLEVTRVALHAASLTFDTPTAVA